MTANLQNALREARDARDRAQDAFVRAVVQANAAGAGYKRIAGWLEMPTSTIQGIVNRAKREER